MIWLLAVAFAEPTLPSRALTSLADTPVAVPGEDTRAVVVTFARKHSEAADAWRTALDGCEVLQVAVVGELGRTSRWIVTTAMKGAYDAPTEARTALAFEEPAVWASALELPNAEEPAVVVLVDGRVRWVHRGAVADPAVAEARALISPMETP
ncbi:MAG: hypothetical protein EP330_27160 [Deltaproteobacteria bacterium]|nr:MAG: hypothetical protein EP330_27160 [Deltaproteobacteria bacterium]